MKRIYLKDNWETYLQNLRYQEITIINKYLKKGYNKILEIGAGNGYQSQFLKKYCNELYCTDLNKHRLKKTSYSNVKYMICDAEKLHNYFQPNIFDLVFSSNLFEHLQNPDLSLKSIKIILKPNGLVINIIPNPFFVVTLILFHYPNLIIKKLEKLLNKLARSKTNSITEHSMNNNLKSKKKIHWLSKLLKLPRPHGIHNSFFKEFKHFSKKYWIKLFRKEGFEIIEIIKGPVYSGYGFGLRPIKNFLEYLRISSEYIYILKMENTKVE